MEEYSDLLAYWTISLLSGGTIMTQDNMWNFGRDVIDRHAQHNPNAPALYLMDGDEDRVLSFGDIARFSGQTVDWLHVNPTTACITNVYFCDWHWSL